MDGLVTLAFVLASIAQFVVAVLLIVVLWHLIAILRNVRDMTDRMRRGTELLADDLSEFRLAVRSESTAFWSGFKSFLKRVPQAFGFAGKKRSRKAKSEAGEEPPDTSES